MTKNQSAKVRIEEEQMYAEVANELVRGFIRDGLWAKALAHSNGADQTVRALYIRYRVQSMKDDARIEAEESKNQRDMERTEKKKEQALDSMSYLFFISVFGVVSFVAFLMSI